MSSQIIAFLYYLSSQIIYYFSILFSYRFFFNLDFLNSNTVSGKDVRPFVLFKRIHKWIETKPVCPVCNSRISKDKLIRLYGITDKPEATSQLDSSAQSSFSDINNTTQQQLDESNQSQTANRSRGRANQVMNSQCFLFLLIFNFIHTQSHNCLYDEAYITNAN